MLVNVKAAGIHPLDVLFQISAYGGALLFTTGKDGASIVQEVGPDTTKFKVW